MIRKQMLLAEKEVELIDQLRQTENRTFSNMVRVLIKKALKEVYPDE